MMGIWEMGQYIETGKPERAASTGRTTNIKKEVLHRRAEMQAQCECLAAWDDSRRCICDKEFEVPLSLSKLNEAHSIAQEIADVDRNIEVAKGLPDEVDCETTDYRSTKNTFVMCHEGSHRGRPAHFKLPKRLVLAALHGERAKLIQQMRDTGVVSVDLPNIKAVPQ